MTTEAGKKVKKKTTNRGKRNAGRKKAAKRVGRRKTGKKATKKATKKVSRRSRVIRPYPASTFKDALKIGKGIMDYGGGERIRRLTLLEKLEMNPASSTTRMAITNSGKYGLTKGSYSADWLELTDTGRIALDSRGDPAARRRAELDLAIVGVEPFKRCYEEYVGKRLPDRDVIKDFVSDTDLGVSDLNECVDTFIVNAKDLGLIRSIAGVDTLVSIDQALEEVTRGDGTPGVVPEATAAVDTSDAIDWHATCFYITPIGPDGSEQRLHADAFMSALVEPALRELGLAVVRADKIGKPGMITSQVLEHLHRCRLAVADLSFLNPNVFYEVALRHALKLPVVQIIRTEDRLPFDINHVRTVRVDTNTPYALAQHLEVHRAEIASQARSALQDPSSVGNPVTVFYPGFHKETPTKIR